MATFGTFTVGQVLTAAELNSGGAYTAFTPTWSGITVGNATQEWHYCEFNKMVHVFGNILFGSTTTIATVPIMTLPVAREGLPAGIVNMGVGTLADAATATYMAFCLSTTTTNCILFSSTSNGNFVTEGGVGATTPFTWTTNDSFSMNLIYKAA